MTRTISKVEPKYRRPLNNEQVEVLRLLYRHRFSTNELTAKYLDKTNIKVVQKKLKILEDQGLIAKRYEKTYKLQGRPAEYYLTPKGARLLKTKDDPKSNDSQKVTEQGIKNLYKNPNISEDYIKHCLNILKVALHFKTLYSDKLDPFTRMQMIPFNYLPSWRPDLFLSLHTGAKATSKRFFLDIWDGTRPFFVSVRKARGYITYSESGDWLAVNEFPVILMLCDNVKNETKLRRQIRKALEESYEEMAFATATIKAFISSESKSDKVWKTVTEYSEDDRHSNLNHILKSLE